jgi:hypothetical protein
MDSNKINYQLNNWTQKYFHFNGLKFSLNEEYSAFNVTRNIIWLNGAEPHEHNIIFRQFLYEYGATLAATNFKDISLIFLHELGHCLTRNYYDSFSLGFYDLMKRLASDAIAYWHVQDEFEANMIVVNFINNNPEAVKELDMIFEGWM